MMKFAVIPGTEEFWALLGATVSAAMKTSRLACAGFIKGLFNARQHVTLLASCLMQHSFAEQDALSRARCYL